MPNTRSGASRTPEGTNEQIDRRLAGALGTRDATKNLEPLIGGGGKQDEISGNGGNREEIEMEEMEIKEMEMEERMEMVMGTEEEMVIILEVLCIAHEADDRGVLSKKQDPEDGNRVDPNRINLT
ncbi:hypothetical protein Tco_1254580 [Tanacetum coccineum]